MLEHLSSLWTPSWIMFKAFVSPPVRSLLRCDLIFLYHSLKVVSVHESKLNASKDVVHLLSFVAQIDAWTIWVSFHCITTPLFKRLALGNMSDTHMWMFYHIGPHIWCRLAWLTSLESASSFTAIILYCSLTSKAWRLWACKPYQWKRWWNHQSGFESI